MNTKILLFLCSILSTVHSMEKTYNPRSLLELTASKITHLDVLQNKRPYLCEKYARKKSTKLPPHIPLAIIASALHPNFPLSYEYQKQIALTFLENPEYSLSEKQLPEIISLIQHCNDIEFFKASAKHNIYIPLTKSLAHRLLETAHWKEFITKADLQVIMPRKNIENKNDMKLFSVVLDEKLQELAKNIEYSVNSRSLLQEVRNILTPFKRAPLRYQVEYETFSFESKLSFYILSTAALSHSSISNYLLGNLFEQSPYYNEFDKKNYVDDLSIDNLCFMGGQFLILSNISCAGIIYLLESYKK